MHPNQPQSPNPEPTSQHPTAEQTTAFPVVAQPVSEQPVSSVPVSGQPVSGQPVSGEPENVAPAWEGSAGQPATVQPTTVQPTMAPGAAQPGAAQPDAGQPGTNHPGAGPAAIQPHAVQPGVPQQGGYPTGVGYHGAPPFGTSPPPPAPPPAPPRPGLRMSLGDALAGGGALLVVLFSFTPFVGYDDTDLIERLEEENLPTWFSAWALETFLAPLTWWVIFAALALVAVVGLRFLVPKDREFAGFRFSHVQVGLAFFAFFVLLGYALSAKTLLFGSELQDESTVDGDVSLSWGGSLMLVGALVAAVGAVLDHLNLGPTVWPAPPRPAYLGQPQPGYPAPDAYPHSYPQGQPAHPQGQPGYPQPQADYAAGQATVAPPTRPSGYPPNT